MLVIWIDVETNFALILFARLSVMKEVWLPLSNNALAVITSPDLETIFSKAVARRISVGLLQKVEHAVVVLWTEEVEAASLPVVLFVALGDCEFELERGRSLKVVLSCCGCVVSKCNSVWCLLLQTIQFFKELHCKVLCDGERQFLQSFFSDTKECLSCEDFLLKIAHWKSRWGDWEVSGSCFFT